MFGHTGSRCLVVALVASLVSVACDSPHDVSGKLKPEPRGTFQFGDSAVGTAERWLSEATRIREILHGPQGAGFAASRGMTLDQARASVEESIAYYKRTLFRMSPAGAIARLEGQRRNALEELEALTGPAGRGIAADLGMTLEQAVAELEGRIELFSRHIAARRASLRGDRALDDDCSSPADSAIRHLACCGRTATGPRTGPLLPWLQAS